MRNWITQHALRLGSRMVVWAYVRMAKDKRWSPEQVQTTRLLAMQEQNAIWASILSVISWNKTEKEIVTERLARRFDPGMTLNEVANRAIEAKRIVRDEPQLSGSQLKALEFQRQYLERVVKNS